MERRYCFEVSVGPADLQSRSLVALHVGGGITVNAVKEEVNDIVKVDALSRLSVGWPSQLNFLSTSTKPLPGQSPTFADAVAAGYKTN